MLVWAQIQEMLVWGQWQSYIAVTTRKPNIDTKLKLKLTA